MLGQRRCALVGPNAPAPSLGTFGNLKIRWFSEGGNAQKVNEAVNLTMEVNGSGNLGLIGEPEIEWPSDLETFDPEIKDRIRTDVNGQKGHGHGHIDASWDNGTAQITMIPTKPRWLADRPMQTVITHQGDGSVDVRTKRIASTDR